MIGSDPTRELAGLYLHVPFCSRVCPYCDFAVTTGSRELRARFVRALCREIERHAGTPFEFDTIYFGGGTPSLLDLDELGRVLEAARRALRIVPHARIHLEANPEDASEENLAGWRALGVHMLSLGVQSFDDAELRFLGRRHRSEEARRSLAKALATGFPIVSIDLIYGLPDARTADWTRNLAAAVELGPQHISCYQLTIHEGTPFRRWRDRGQLRELPDGEQAKLFMTTHRTLSACGYEGYEVSSFARERRSRSPHNQKYWHHVPYLGLGPSAHSFDGLHRRWNERGLNEYLEKVENDQPALAGEETLGEADLALERLMLGLRTSDGIDTRRFHERFGIDLESINRERLDALHRSGRLAREEGRLRLTTAGMAIADAIAASLDLSPGPSRLAVRPLDAPCDASRDDGTG